MRTGDILSWHPPPSQRFGGGGFLAIKLKKIKKNLVLVKKESNATERTKVIVACINYLTTS
jgi:hypothetical protein